MKMGMLIHNFIHTHTIDQCKQRDYTWCECGYLICFGVLLLEYWCAALCITMLCFGACVAIGLVYIAMLKFLMCCVSVVRYESSAL